jgi:hypothetical protein
VGVPNPPGFVGPTGKSALVALYRSISSYFVDQEVEAKVLFGLKERDLWETSRVVVIDGIFDGNVTPKALDAGAFFAPTQKKSANNPRELVSWPRPVTLSIRGVDITNVDSEAHQTEAMEALIEATLQGIQNAVDPKSGTAVGQANLDWGRCQWLKPPVQQSFGMEFLLGMTLKCVFFDLAQGVAFPTAVIGKNLLDTKRSGRAAFVLNAGGGTATVTGLNLCNLSYIGQLLQLSGAATSANNGTFPIVDVLSSVAVEIDNFAAVSPDANNGAIAWKVLALT